MHEDKIFEKNFVSDVKDRIDEISKKYILTDEGTVDFALNVYPFGIGLLRNCKQ